MASVHRLELVPDDEPASEGCGNASPDRSVRPPLVRRRARLSLGLAGLAVVILAALVATGSWLTSTAEEARVAAPGAVASLVVAPARAWAVDAVDPRVVPVGDVLVTVTDDGVQGRDVTTGALRWHALDGSARCGPAADEAAGSGPRPDVATCLAGEALAPVAHVVGPRGPLSGPVPLGDDLGRAEPGPAGTVLRWTRTGGVVHLALQDARTAEVRWRQDLPPEDLERTALCRPQVAGQAVVTVERGLLVVLGCRVSAVLTTAGTRLDARSAAVTLDVLPLADGNALRTTTRPPDRTGSTQVVGPDGTVLCSTPGRLLVPLTGPGTRTRTALVATPGQVRALDVAGLDATEPARRAGTRELWRRNLPVRQVAALAEDRAVLVVGEEVVAVDARTGERAWTWPRGTDEGADLDRGVAAAFTDGSTVALVVEDPDAPRSSRVVALALDDGSVRWDVRYDADPRGFTAVGGRLVHADPSTARVVVHG